MIDLRSDTVTKPTAAMLKAMTEAKVGDDVFEEDPTVNTFQEELAEKFGFEAGLFMPSGVMANQVALSVLTHPGEEVLIDEKGHMFNYENTSAAWLSAVQLKPLPGTGGKLSAGLIKENVRGRFDWEPKTSVIVLENTTNKGGGRYYREEELDAIYAVAQEYKLAIHMDGARIWNALTAGALPPLYFGSIADTMSIAFSKGLGAPAGSMLLSNKECISRARRVRKMLGGGMRQIGLLAAAAKYGVEHHFNLLKHDHRRADELASAISKCNMLSIDETTVETNIVIFDTLDETAGQALSKLKKRDILMVPFGPKTIRATFHFQVDDEQLAYTRKTILELFNR